MRGRIRNVGMALPMALASCGGGSAEPRAPVEIQKLMAADFPADGQIHVQSRGNFVISSETAVCRAARNIDRSLEDSAPRFLGPGLGEAGAAKSSGLSAELGKDLGNGQICRSDGVNITNQWRLKLNRNGRPYELVLAVWQGDPAEGGAFWVGAVERMPGRYHPKSFAIAGEDGRDVGERQWQSSVALDGAELSGMFVNILSKSEK